MPPVTTLPPSPTAIRDTSAQDQPVSRRRAWRRRALAPAAVGVALVALLAWGGPWAARRIGLASSVSTERLTIATVERGSFTRDITADGRVVAANSPTLYATNAGNVTLRVHAGDAVTQGQVLAVVASPDLAARLAQERSDADALQSEVLRAEADARQQRARSQGALETAEIAAQSARNELARQTQAFDAGATARMQVDQARDAQARADVALKQARQMLGLQDDATRFEIQAKQQAWQRQQLLVQDLERQRDALTLRSPVDGQVGQLFVGDRTSVARDAQLMTVVDLSRLEVQMQVPESFARDLQPGMPGVISGNGRHWNGRVSSISPEVVDGQVAARLRFDGARPAELRQNQRLSVRVLLDRRPDVLMLPRGSFVDTDGGHFAYVVRDDVAERRPIRLGAHSLAQVEVLSGLRAGDRVVIAGSENFGGAARVAISH
jgi:HlyD family secretion protein